MIRRIQRCEHCGCEYEYQASGHGSSKYNDKHYCHTCKEQIVLALAKIPKKFKLEYIQTDEVSVADIIEYDMNKVVDGLQITPFMLNGTIVEYKANGSEYKLTIQWIKEELVYTVSKQMWIDYTESVKLDFKKLDIELDEKYIPSKPRTFKNTMTTEDWAEFGRDLNAMRDESVEDILVSKIKKD